MFDVFSGIGEEGCFFHLCKRLDFQVKEGGLSLRKRSHMTSAAGGGGFKMLTVGDKGGGV